MGFGCPEVNTFNTTFFPLKYSPFFQHLYESLERNWPCANFLERKKGHGKRTWNQCINLLCSSLPTAFTLRWDCSSIETGGAQTAHGCRGASLHAPLHLGAQTLQSLLSTKGDQARIFLHQGTGLVTYIYSTVQQGKSDLNSNTAVSMFLKGILGLCGRWPMLPDTFTHSLKP